MATELSNEELISFRELLMTKEIYMEALVQLLVEKGILSKKDLLGKIKQIQMDLAAKSKS